MEGGGRLPFWKAVAGGGRAAILEGGKGARRLGLAAWGLWRA